MGSQVVNVGYDNLDNITSKSDYENNATYEYSGAQVHAVKKVGNRSFVYDPNGNVLEEKYGADVIKKFSYNAENRVRKIVQSANAATNTQAHTSEFFYDSSQNRFKRIDTDAQGKITTTLYLGSVEKTQYADGTQEWKRQIAGMAQITHSVVSGKITSSRLVYFHKDHLGTTEQITDAAGVTLQRMAFDPWGARRKTEADQAMITGLNMSKQSILASFAKTAKPITNRGYTGHEMLDEVGIIHMNGRIYDAYLGRFLQADPLIQEPTLVGSLNRYSYVMNNPMNAVDPTGFSWLSKVWKQLRPLVGSMVAIGLAVINPAFFLGSWQGALLGGVISGAAGAAATGQNIFKGALNGGISALAFYGVGKYFKGLAAANKAETAVHSFGGLELTTGQIAGQITAHAAVGGVLSVVQGGKFGHGFVSAGFSKGAMGFFPGGDVASRAFMSGAVNGVVTEISGGKFANGFSTGVFQSLFNETGMKLAEWAKSRIDEISLYFEHGKEISSSEDASFPMPDKTRAALQTVMDSPLGDKIRSAGQKINIVLTKNVQTAFLVNEGTIYYQTDVDAYVASRQNFRISGDGLGSATLGSLLAHEIGHVIGVNSPTGGRAHEIWTVRNFENPYRSHMSMPLRRSYFEKNDVFK